MNKAVKNYKKKIIRKYVEFYPNDNDIIEFLKSRKIPFNSYVKELIRISIKENNSNEY